MQPPPSLVREQDNYLAAVGLFKQSATEALKMFEDGNDEHLLAAYPLGHEGGTRIRAVGAEVLAGRVSAQLVSRDFG